MPNLKTNDMGAQVWEELDLPSYRGRMLAVYEDLKRALPRPVTVDKKNLIVRWSLFDPQMGFIEIEADVPQYTFREELEDLEIDLNLPESIDEITRWKVRSSSSELAREIAEDAYGMVQTLKKDSDEGPRRTQTQAREEDKAIKEFRGVAKKLGLDVRDGEGSLKVHRDTWDDAQIRQFYQAAWETGLYRFFDSSEMDADCTIELTPREDPMDKKQWKLELRGMKHYMNNQ